LPLFHTLAGKHAFFEAGHVCVQGAVAAAMLDNNGASVAALFTPKNDLAVTGSLNRGAASGCVIYAFVQAHFVQYRMMALAKT